MNFLKCVGCNNCSELVEKGIDMYVLLHVCFEKVMFWWEILVQEHKRCGAMDVIGAAHVLYLQNKLLCSY